MIGGGDTLECLNNEPKDALALLAVREDLTNFVVLYSRRSTALVHTEEVYPTKVHLMGGNLQ